MRDERARRYVSNFKTNPRLKGESWKYFESWLKSKAPTTQEIYLEFLIGFLEWLDKDTEEFYEFSLGMIRDEDPRTVMKMGMLVVDYQNHLMKVKGFTGKTVQNVRNAIKGFFKANALSFNLESNEIQVDSIEIPSMSKDQIKKILNSTGNYKPKAYILLARDSGLRVGDISKLPIRVVRAVLDNLLVNFHTFEWKQEKMKRHRKPIPANPVIGPECIEAIRTWMNYRMNTLKLSAKDGDPLFCVEKNRRGFTDKNGREVPAIVKGDWMDDTTMGVVFSQLVRKAGLRPLPNETRLPSFHSLRKYHKTNLEYANVPISWINKMQGRKGEGTGGIYTKPDPHMLKEMYKKGYSALCGIEEGQHEKIEGLTHELGQSQYENAELRKEREEVRAERDRYRADYDSRSRLQGIIDKARLEGWPEEIIKKLEENLESVETFEEGVFEFQELEREIKLDDEQSENWDFKMVDDEAEMILKAKDGWEIFKVLHDGRYVLRRHLSDM